MKESYCIVDKRVTPCTEPSGYQKDKRGRTQFYCKCAVCGRKKVRYVKMSQVPQMGSGAKRKTTKTKSASVKKLNSPSEGAGVFVTVVGTAVDGFVEYGLPWMGRKAVEMGRYGAGGSASPRNPPAASKRRIGGKGITPMDVVKKAPDIAMKSTQTFIPSLKPVYDRYKSGDIFKSAFDSEQGITSSKFCRRPTAEEEKSKGIIRKGSNPELFFAFNKDGKRFRKYKSTFFNENPEALTDMNNIISSNPDIWPEVIRNKYGINIDEHFWENDPLLSFGSGVDIHKWIEKLPRPKAGWTPGKFKYMGPYNPLEQQSSYNPETGEVTEWNVKPYNRVDEIAAYHDICYDMGRPKGDCDREMVQSLDEIPYGEMPKWGSTARFLINTKKKLGLGLQTKNARRR